MTGPMGNFEFCWTGLKNNLKMEQTAKQITCFAPAGTKKKEICRGIKVHETKV